MELSADFKKSVFKSILAIILFVVVYLLLIVFSIGLTVACGYLGIGLMAMRISFITIALGIGVISIGILVLIFLLKFIFKKHEKPQVDYLEITKEDQAQLFKLIYDIASEVGTTKPKKVFLSEDVNASVFYNSTFWSMFFPSKKNLIIGLGLINTLNRGEFKAVLAHEFGYFSQNSMKLGSFVYNVNRIIYNMLYDNNSFDQGAANWANTSGYFSIFVMLAYSIVRIIQKILQSIYEVLNITYLKLSREMEFHADEIATTIAGKENLKTSLLRLDMADFSLNATFNFYGMKTHKNLVSSNVYKDQSLYLKFIAEENDIQLINNLPNVKLKDINKFNKSKLQFEDQWASHPSIEDRIRKIDENGMVKKDQEDFDSARSFVNNFNELSDFFTIKIFDRVAYEGDKTSISSEEFLNLYKSDLEKSTFDKIYNGYYDNKNPEELELDSITIQESDIMDFNELFSNKIVNEVLETVALETDIETLKQIDLGNTGIKTYEYNGKKYKSKESPLLIENLSKELDFRKIKEHENDINIYKFFAQKSAQLGTLEYLKKLYLNLFQYYQSAKNSQKLFENLTESIQFIQVQNQFDEIKRKMVDFKQIENTFKKEYELIYNEIKEEERISHFDHDKIQKYLSKDWSYFTDEKYQENNLELLYIAIQHFIQLVDFKFFDLKSKVLKYQVELLKS